MNIIYQQIDLRMKNRKSIQQIKIILKKKEYYCGIQNLQKNELQYKEYPRRVRKKGLSTAKNKNNKVILRLTFIKIEGAKGG